MRDAPKLLVVREDEPLTPEEQEVARRLMDAFQAYARTVSANPQSQGAFTRAELVFLQAWADATGNLIVASGKESLRVAGVDMSFSLDNPFAVAWVKAHGAELVTQVSDTTKKTIREITTRGFLEQLTVRQQRKLLEEIVPILPEQVRGIEMRLNQRISAGEGQEMAVVAAGREARRLVRIRAELIARTEVVFALNGGTHAAYQAANADGLFTDPVERVWIATVLGKRTCDICRAWDGTTAPLDGPFVRGGRSIMNPPLHPRCRCTQGIRRVQRT